MPDTSRSIQNEQYAAILTGLRQFSELPGWLASVKDTRLTHEILSRTIPEFASGKLILKKCKIGHMYFEGGYWSNLCELKVSLPGESSESSISLRGTLFPPGSISIDRKVVEGSLGGEGWRAVIPELNLVLKPREPETRLEALEFLTDPEKSCRFLEQILRTGSPAYRNIQIQSCQPKIVRYKAGDRCTILYDLKYAPDNPKDQDGPDRVVAKVNWGEKGLTAYESLVALWNSPFGASKTVHIAEPLAYHPELRVFIQAVLREEQTLEKLFESAVHAGTAEAMEELNDYLCQTAVGLAEIHRSMVRYGQPAFIQDEVRELQEQVRQLSTVFPYLSDAAAPFFERLSQLEAATPADTQVPSHGTFRPAQVLLYDGEISFIDFDSFCQSEPANDLSLFFATVLKIGLTPSSLDKGKSPDQTIANPAFRLARFELLSSICAQFTDIYEQYQPVSRQRLALWQAVYVFHYVLSGWIKNKADEVAYLVDLLERFLLSSNIVSKS